MYSSAHFQEIPIPSYTENFGTFESGMFLLLKKTLIICICRKFRELCSILIKLFCVFMLTLSFIMRQVMGERGVCYHAHFFFYFCPS